MSNTLPGVVDVEHEATVEILRLLNTGGKLRELIQNVVVFLRNWSGCEAVGIRLRDGDDFPYFEVSGFSEEFVHMENRLCQCDEQGQVIHDDANNPVLECMCGNILSGRFDPAKPFFTTHGSFWSNCTTELLATTSEADRQARTRNRCNGEGYESVALVPMHNDQSVLGLIQINDHRKGMFSLAFITLIERLADSIAKGLAEKQAREALLKSERFARSTLDALSAHIAILDEKGVILAVNRAWRNFALSNSPDTIHLNEGANYLAVCDGARSANSAEAAAFAAGIRAVISGEQDIFSLEYPCHSPAEQRWFIGRVSRFPEGEHVRIVVAHENITTRKQAEQALRDSEERNRRIVTTAIEGVWSMDAGFRTTFVNSRMAEMLGYIPDEMLGRDVKYFMFEEDLTDHSKKMEHRLEGENAQYERRFRHKDGSAVWTIVSATALKDDHGRFAGSFGMFTDITERKRTEEALRESEAHYRSLVENTPDIIVRFDRQHRHLFINAAVWELLGLSAGDFIGKRHRELGFPENQCLFWESALDDVFRTGLSYETEFGFEDQQGPVLFNWRLVPELNASGEIESVLSIARDITAHRKIEQDYAQLFTSMLTGFAVHEILLDEAGAPCDYRFLSVNPAFEKLTGLRAENILGRTVLEVMPNTEIVWIERYGKVALTGEPIQFENYSEELRRHFEVTAYAPRLGQFVTLFQDITERKRLEAELRQAHKMEAVGQLAGGVAHDFNNLLQVILGNVEVLQGNCAPDSPNRSGLDEVCKAAERAAELTRQLLTFSRRQVIQLVDLDLNDLIQGVLKMIRRVIGEHIHLCFMPGDRLGSVHADPGQMEQIIMNLCVNARDAMTGGGTLTLATNSITIDNAYCDENPWAVPGRYAQFSVTDTGCGMDEATCAQIFEPFFTTKGIGHGTGLGLSMVYGIVKQHEGLIQVCSEPGKGTTFNICLPLIAPMAEVVEVIIEEPVMGGSETILVAEDERMVRDLVSRMLLAAGYTVLTAGDGKDALQVFGKHADTIDLVLLDVIMPNLGGREVMERIRATHPRTRFLFSSGYSEDAIHTNYIIQDGLRLIAKPHRQQELLRAVRDILDQPEDG